MHQGALSTYDMRTRSDVIRIRERKHRREERLRAQARSALWVRRFTPAETLDMGFELIESARSLSDAAEASNAGRRR